MSSKSGTREKLFCWLVLLFTLWLLTAALSQSSLISTGRAKADAAFLKDVESSLVLAKAWLFRNIRDKGLFVYAYDPARGSYSTKNNEIRQLLASRVLAVECAKTEEAALCGSHEKNLDFIFEHWYREDERGGHVEYEGKSKLGANAMLLRVLVASAYLAEHDDRARELFRTIQYMQNEDGSFRAWYIEPPYDNNDAYLLTFYSGEAILALLEYYEQTGSEEALVAAKRAQDYYLGLYVDRIDETYYPALVPWHTTALSKLYAITEETRYADAAFVLADKLLEMQDQSEYVGRFYDPRTPQYGEPHASSDAVYTEGLSYALELAQAVGDNTREARYREALILAFRNLASLQYSASIQGSSEPFQRYRGALRIRAGSTWIRLDATVHAIDAFENILRVWN